MTARRTEDLIGALGADVKAVEPLRSPLRRALVTLAATVLIGGLAIALLADLDPLALREPGEGWMAMLELGAMLATGGLAVTGAFFLSIPGRSRRWLAAPIVPLLIWLGVSGFGCYRLFARTGSSGWEAGHGGDCLFFILAASLVIGAPLVWRLSRAAPVDPVPVALLGGLGTAALAAFMLQFFHPFAVTFLDLAVHVAAVLVVIGAMALLNRHVLRPA